MKDSARIRRAETAAQIKDAMEAAGLTRKEFAEKMGKSSLYFNREIPSSLDTKRVGKPF